MDSGDLMAVTLRKKPTKPSLKKKPKKKKPALYREPKPEPFDPLAPQYTSPSQIETAALQQARSQIQPALDEITREETRAQGMTDRRRSDLKSWYDWAGGVANQAVGTTTAGLGALTGANNTASQRAQDTLAAALKSTQGQEDQFANMLNASSVNAADPNVMGAVQANDSANQQMLASAAAAAMGVTGAQPGQFALGGVRSLEDEARRYQGVMDELGGARRSTTARLPDLLASIRDNIWTREGERYTTRTQLSEAKANRRFQESLAGQELGLKKRSQNFQEDLAEQELGEKKRSARVQEGLSAAGIGIDQQNADTQRAALEQEAAGAGTEEDKKLAEARAKRFNNGVAALNSYLTPGKDDFQEIENPDGTKKRKVASSYYKRLSFDQALRMLRGQTGMGPLESLYLLRDTVNTSDPFFKRWNERAKKMINDHLNPGWRTRKDIKEGRVAKPKGKLGKRPPKNLPKG